MMNKKESPERLETLRSSNNLYPLRDDYRGEVTLKLSNRQKKVYTLLMAGKHTVTEMTIKTGFSDPRGYVRELRNRGINVRDEWIKKDDVRYKRYWIETDNINF
jgi:hypothetical protein